MRHGRVVQVIGPMMLDGSHGFVWLPTIQPSQPTVQVPGARRSGRSSYIDDSCSGVAVRVHFTRYGMHRSEIGRGCEFAPQLAFKSGRITFLNSSKCGVEREEDMPENVRIFR